MPKSSRQPDPLRGDRKPSPKMPTKARELSPLTFLYHAAYKGLIVVEPDGDDLRYDTIIDNGPRLSCIQVKSSGTEISPGRYHVNCARRLGLVAIPYEKRRSPTTSPSTSTVKTSGSSSPSAPSPAASP